MPTSQASDQQSKALGPLLKPVRGALILACLLQAIGAVALLVPFVAVAELARELLSDGAVDDGRLWAIAWVAIGGFVLRLALLYAAAGITHFADADFQLDVRRRLAERMGRVPLGWFDNRTAGEIKKTIADDVATMHHLVGHTFIDLTAAVVTPLAALGYMFYVDWRLTLIVLVPLLVGLVLFSRQMSGYGEKMTKYNSALEDVNSGAVEFVNGIAVVKTFGQTGRAHKRFLDAANRLVDYFWEWVRGLLRVSATAEVVLSPLTSLVVVAAAGTWFLSNGWISAPDLVVFFLLGLALASPILALGYAMDEMQTAAKAAARVAAVLDAPVLPEAEDPRQPKGGRVEYRGVGFSYDGEHQVLHGVDLTLEPGTVNALVGPSGSGKSTLAKLLCRFWDPTDGSVTVGGVDLRDIAMSDLYRSIGFVFQDVQLLRGTVADNIRLGRPDADSGTVRAAAEAAQIHDRITELPRGYESIIGEDAQLSGGEAQRVSIARAILADAPILVLDEATAFADPESEAAIQDALSNLAAGRTLLVIAHRLSTVVHAHQIAVVVDGAITERGTHDELLAAGGRYQRLWQADDRANVTIVGGGS